MLDRVFEIVIYHNDFSKGFCHGIVLRAFTKLMILFSNILKKVTLVIEYPVNIIFQSFA